MIDPRHDRLEAGVAHDIENTLVVDRDDDASDIGFRRALATWTIIGRPQISASGLPGRRVEAMRAGMSTMALPEFSRIHDVAFKNPAQGVKKFSSWAPIISVATQSQKT